MFQDILHQLYFSNLHLSALLTKGGAKSPIVAGGLADCREWRPDDPGLFIFMLISKDDLFG